MLYRRARDVLVICGLVLIGSQPSLPQDQSTDSFGDLSTRKSIQQALIWSGHYDGLLDGVIGNLTISGIKDYQRSVGHDPTGLPTDDEKRALLALSSKAMRQAGWSAFDDAKAGFRLFLPLALLHIDQSAAPSYRGASFASADNLIKLQVLRFEDRGLDELFDRIQSVHKGEITYMYPRDGQPVSDRFVVSGTEGKQKRFYVRADARSRDIRAFSISWDATQSAQWNRIVVAISATFSPFDPLIVIPKPEMPTSEIAKPPVRTEDAKANRPVPNSTSTTTLSAGPPGLPVPGVRGNAPAEKRVGISGSGFFVGPMAYVLTNAHVIEGCSAIKVGTYDQMEVVGADSSNDLALLRIRLSVEQEKPRALAHFATDSVRLGEEVIALGYPLQSILENGLNTTVGNVTAESGPGGDKRYVQISTPANAGNSGGPLVDRRGRVVGLVTSKLNTKLASGEVPQAVNFALKNEILFRFLQKYGVKYETRLGPTTDLPEPEVIGLIRDAVQPIGCGITTSEQP
jgi:serine protease Do